jgi:flagellar protein FliL
MKQFLAPIIVVVGILAGGAGGFFLKNMGADKSGAPVSEADGHAAKEKDDGKSGKDGKSDGHGSKDKKEKGQKKDDKAHGGSKDSHSAGGENEISYFKFSREFIVPIMSGNRVSELVILNISLETDESISQTLFSQEPKLRDNIMTTLIALSNDGVTFESMTAVDNYETLRSTILMNLDSVVADGIENVLILDLAKQEI